MWWLIAFAAACYFWRLRRARPALIRARAVSIVKERQRSSRRSSWAARCSRLKGVATEVFVRLLAVPVGFQIPGEAGQCAHGFAWCVIGEVFDEGFKHFQGGPKLRFGRGDLAGQRLG